MPQSQVPIVLVNLLLANVLRYQRNAFAHRGQCILFSVVFTPFSPPPPRQCLGPICHLSTLNYLCLASAGLPIHMIGEVSCNIKRRRVWATQFSILSAFALPCLVTLVSSHGTTVQNVLESFAFLGTEPGRIYKLRRICKAHFKG